MPTPPNIDDLTDLSATGAMLECVLHDWVYEITQLTTPDIPTLAEAIDFFARLTAIRKTLIKLSRLEPPKPHASPSPSPAIPDSSTSPSDPETRDRRAPESPDPATLIFDQATQLPVPLLDPLPSIPCIPLDQLRPELENLSTALNHVCSEIFSENSTTLTTDDSPLDSDQLDDTPDS
ncbi:hypothetical protein LLG95_17635, partial [bacterium]|nr:hypothetical protein [bacterium]